MRARIVTLPGDGIGVEVVAEGVKVLQAVADKYGHQFTFENGLIGGCAIDATGTPLPEETLVACHQADAVLFGAVGDPRYDDPAAPVRPEQGLMRLRKELGLYANLRPVRLHRALVDASPLRPQLLESVDSVSMLLRHSLGLEGEAAAVERAVETTLDQGYRTADIAGDVACTVNTTQMGDLVTAVIRDQG